MTEKLKTFDDATEALRATQNRYAPVKADFTRLYELAKREMTPGDALSITVAPDTSTSFFLEHLDRRAKVTFRFHPGSGRGNVVVYDVTSTATAVSTSNVSLPTIFEFSFDGDGKTTLSPPKLEDSLSLRRKEDALCILLNIVDRLVGLPYSDP
jgi:hypothetical protein